VLAAFSLDLGSVRAARANAELRIPRQLDRPTQSPLPRAVRFFAKKKGWRKCRHPPFPSAGLLRTPFCERSSRGHAHYKGRSKLKRGATTLIKPQNIHREDVVARSARRWSLISARNGSANSLSFCCPTPAICANSLLLCGHARAISRSVASEKIM